METIKCYGKTRSGFRCKNNSKYHINCFDTSFSVCGIHREQNIINVWCDTDKNNEIIPDKIFNFMCLYGRCLYTFKLSNPLSCLITSKIHDRDDFHLLNKEDTLKTFFDLFFKVSKNIIECPICYNNKKSVKMPKCDHLICKDCICSWTIKTANCPMCRKAFSTQE